MMKLCLLPILALSVTMQASPAEPQASTDNFRGAFGLGTVVAVQAERSLLTLRESDLWGHLRIRFKSYQVKQPFLLYGLHPGDKITAVFSTKDSMLHRRKARAELLGIRARAFALNCCCPSGWPWDRRWRSSRCASGPSDVRSRHHDLDLAIRSIQLLIRGTVSDRVLVAQIVRHLVRDPVDIRQILGIERLAAGRLGQQSRARLAFLASLRSSSVSRPIAYSSTPLFCASFTRFSRLMMLALSLPSVTTSSTFLSRLAPDFNGRSTSGWRRAWPCRRVNRSWSAPVPFWRCRW